MLMASLDELDRRGKPGDWWISTGDEYLVLKLPTLDPMQDTCALRIKPYADNESRPVGSGAVWSWDGSREEPTLSPSILHHSVPPWHGYLRSGKLEVA